HTSVNHSADPSTDGSERDLFISIFPLSSQPARHSSRVNFSFDLHDFRGASILKRNRVAHVRGEERLADRRNPTDGVRFEIEFVNTDDGIGFGPAFFIFYRHRCAEANTVRCRVRRIDNVDRRHNLLQFGDTLADGVCHAKLLQFLAQMLRTARGDVIGRARGQPRRRSLSSAALRKIHIFFDERPAHLKKYGSAISFQRFRFHRSIRTVPVNQSASPLLEGCEPLRLVSQQESDSFHVVVAHCGSSPPACSATIYLAYQSAQFASRSPVSFSCSPWAASARRSPLARSLDEPNVVAAESIRPGRRLLISWSSQPFSSGSVNDANE